MLQLLRPFLYVWACLSFIDDISIVMKVLRLVGVSTFNRSGEDPEKICNLCDGLMENILRGSEGFEAVPCSWICLKTKRCTNMCRKIQDVFQESYVSQFFFGKLVLLISPFLPHYRSFCRIFRALLLDIAKTKTVFQTSNCFTMTSIAKKDHYILVNPKSFVEGDGKDFDLLVI